MKFISLEGIDGSGKTSILHKLKNQKGIGIIEKKQVQSDDKFINTQIERIKSAMYPGFDGQYDHTLGSSYWIYLQCVWYDLIHKNLVIPADLNIEVLVVDGWFYKFIAKVAQEGFELEQLRTVFALVPEPDKVVMLDVEPDVAIIRKNDFSHYEAGSHQGLDKSQENFVMFQSRIRENLLRQKTDKWTILSIGGEEPIDTTVAKFLAEIR